MLRGDLTGGGDGGVGASVLVDGAMLECLVLMYASSEGTPCPVIVMLSGVVLVIWTSLLRAMCFSCCPSNWSTYFLFSSISNLASWNLDL